MQVEFKSKFEKDIAEIKLKSVADSVERQIEIVENCKSVVEFIRHSNVTKMVGHVDCYRIKFGDYRIGVKIVGNVVYFVRFGIRSTIYKIFP
jgi:mRNA interferase RelE/StbE